MVDERELMRDALKRSMGEATFAEVKARVREARGDGRVHRGRANAAPGPGVHDGEMIELERDTIRAMRAGQDQHEALAASRHAERSSRTIAHLSDSQRAAVEQILASRDQVTGLEGVAGAGKTTSLAAVREAAEREGYTVEGFAPTSRAAQQLEEAGIESSTLQHHLARSEEPARRTEAALRSRRIESRQHETDARVSPAAKRK